MSRTRILERLPAVVEQIRPILQAIERARGRPLIVGGAVRDFLRGFEPNDADIEVYGASIDLLERCLVEVGRVDAVGKAFGVLKVTCDGRTIDVSVPRRENKIGVGHRSFRMELATLTPQEAASRRDFTMNALAVDPSSGHLYDFFGGVQDLEDRVLRHTSDAFAEDPLRVFRGMQFAARFEMRLAPETAVLAASMLPEAPSLPRERVWEEWRKWAVKGVQPSAGLEVLKATGWLLLYPALARLDATPQDPSWHPEGNVLQHTMHVVDAAARIARRDGLSDDDRLVLLFAALCHDLGKPDTTMRAEGRIRSVGHAEAGLQPTEEFLGSVGAPADLIRTVCLLVREHLAHLSMPLEARAVRRLALRLHPVSIEQWARLVEADQSGRPPLAPTTPAQPYVEMARELEVAKGKPAALLRGRDLLALGMTEGPEVGVILRAAYDAQISGAFETAEGAVHWARSLNRLGKKR